MVECKLSLELTKNGVQKSVHAKMGEKDSRKLLVTLTEKGKVFDLEGYEARVSYDDKTYTKATIDGNVVEFILPSTLLSGPGERLCELEISVPGESVLYSPMFIVNVEGSLGAEAKNEAVGKDVEYQQVIPDLEETAVMGDEAYIAVYEEGKGTKKYKVEKLGGASKHSELSGRDEDDQHPIESISGLRDTLDEIDGMTYHNLAQISSAEEKIKKINEDVETLKNSSEGIAANSHSHDNKAILDELYISYYEGLPLLSYKNKIVGPLRHRELLFADENDLHPISAITGLEGFVLSAEESISEITEKTEGLAEKSHSHSNKSTLDRLDVSAGNVLTFDGKEIGSGGGSGSTVNVPALAPQIVATLLTTSRIPAVFEEPDVASMDTSQFFEKLSMLPEADSMLIYAPGKRGTLQVFDVGFDYSLYGLTVEESGLYVFKCDIPNGGMMQVATAYGETIRQALIQGIESLTFNYLSEAGTLIE